jgi:hypothetical protein
MEADSYLDPQGFRVEATTGAADFVLERGGRLFVWDDQYEMLHTSFQAPADGGIDFARCWCEGFEFNLDKSIIDPDRRPVWYVVLHHLPVKHIEVEA